MLDIPAAAVVLYPVGILYLLLHAGPLLGLWHDESIAGNTSWRFFASEVALFVAYLVFVPAIATSSVGRLAIGVHLAQHVALAIGDYLRHDAVLSRALASRRTEPLRWLGKEAGLIVDTAAHVVAVALLADRLRPALALGLLPAPFAGFWLVTRAYVRAWKRG